MKFLILIGIILSLNSAWANRSVSIAVPDGKLTLVNGSDVTVTYTAECFDRTSGANVLTGASSVTLAPKGEVSYQSAGTCASGLNPTYKSPENAVACSGSVNYAGAAALCGAASNLCNFNDLTSRGINSLQNFPHNHWITASADPFYTTWDNWSKNYPYATTGGGKEYQILTYTSKGLNSSQRCANSAGTSGSNAGIGNCSTGDKTGTYSGAICCPTNNGFKSCKVTILPATPTAGHLQSPQFKGGASF